MLLIIIKPEERDFRKTEVTRHTQIITVKYYHSHTACVFFGCNKDPYMIMLGFQPDGLDGIIVKLVQINESLSSAVCRALANDA